MRKTALCLALILASVVGSTGQSYAAGPLHQFFYNTSGIQHDAGFGHGGIYMIRNGVHYDNRTVWDQIDEDANQSMWYGPKDDVQGGANFQACWYYTRPTHWPTTVIFDITYGSTPTILWSSGSLTLNPLGGNEPAIWPLEQTCHTVSMPNPLYTKFQVRVRVTSVHYEPSEPYANGVKVYKTSYQAL